MRVESVGSKWRRRGIALIAAGAAVSSLFAIGSRADACCWDPWTTIEYYRERVLVEAEQTIAPSRPTDLRAELVKPRSARLTWNPSSPGVFGFAYYFVYRWDSATSWYKYLTTTDPFLTDSTLQRRVTYSYHVVACDDRGNCSDWSNGAEVTP